MNMLRRLNHLIYQMNKQDKQHSSRNLLKRSNLYEKTVAGGRIFIQKQRSDEKLTELNLDGFKYQILEAHDLKYQTTVQVNYSSGNCS